ncbi:hypothetical protein ASPZODRAFT_13035 [Penicilliopsis zonata CBS 506.65]|uniref:Synaptobrevin n=1 Tax=Penicilliopsis zonata CBS 506.65 TaxID=1073090 RepID=A0A1L9SS25_9EURO|nr:hypothetical protein ASPZODRAFT_13035 [Penicilliopsis zonata CBS 506.65]OJJ49926.1 hypothetical protein ASPZODRAFT_13035 [Penicilliopsis zonata CBS 506.65]
MTLTVFPSPDPGDSPDLALLNLSALFTRLEHNLLSPGADLSPLRRSEYQRMRVGANLEYARSLLVQVEKSLPQIKPLERRHEIQLDLNKRRQTLKSLSEVLEELSAEGQARRVNILGSITGRPGAVGIQLEDDDDDDDDEDDDGEDLLATPEGESTSEHETAEEVDESSISTHEDQHLTPSSTASLAQTPDVPATTHTLTPTPTASLRHRHQTSPPTTTATATATGTATGSADLSKLSSTEATLSAHRQEQEDLTTSLLSLASQLKASSQAFHSSLESEKSILGRAVEGLDKTTTGMQAAEKRMGMLRRMTEGKGWWGRIMLYAWIFGLWVVAILIVFVGPKLRL